MLLCVSLTISFGANALLSVTVNIQCYGTIGYAPPIQSQNPASAQYTAPFHVSGNQILDSNNKTVILQGIGRMGPEYDTTFTSRETNPAYYAQDFAMMEGWGVNFIRQPFNLLAYNTSATYRADLQAEVNAEISDGFFVLLDAHWFNDSQFPNGIFTNNNAITETANYDSVNQNVTQWCYTMVFPTLGGMAQTFNTTGYNNVIGMEINEFWPDSNRTQNWLSDQAIFQDMADYIHLTAQCPKYLIFWDMGFFDGGNFPLLYKVGTSDNQNIVYCLHTYIDPSYIPWFDGYLGNATYDSGWNYTAYYQEGDNTDGQILLDRYYNNYVLPIQTTFNVPIVADEFGVDRNVAAGLNDMLNYFSAYGWGFAYWAWYGTADSTNMALLNSDWESPAANAVVLIQHLDYQPIFQWNNAPLVLAETYNWGTNTALDTITYPTYPTNTTFSDSFQSGNFNAWTANVNGPTIVTSPVYGSNLYAMCAGGNQYMVYENIPSTYSVSAQCYLYFTSFPTSGNLAYAIRLQATGAQAGVENKSGSVVWAFRDGYGGITLASSGPKLNTWYELNMTYVSGSYLGIYVNGAKVASETPPYTENENSIAFGCTDVPNGAQIYVDNCSIYSAVGSTPPSSYAIQFYALNVTANTQVTLSNGTAFAALPYWNSTTKLLIITIDPAETSVAVTDPTLK